MKRWKYRCESFTSGDVHPTSREILPYRLNDLGSMGWELVSFVRHDGDSYELTAIFKRELPEGCES